MMIRTLALAVPLALAAPTFAAAPDADQGQMRHRMGPEMGAVLGSPTIHRLMMAMHSLDLTEDQKTQIHSLMDQFHTANEAKLTQMGNAHKALVDRVLAEPIDEAGIRGDIAAMAAVHADVAVAEAYLAKDLRGVLTSDQRDQLEKALATTPDDMPRHHGG
jgi:Spy/CpxP family protein refolding chaperone